MSIDQRLKKAKDLRLCFKCLKNSHMTGDCKSTRVCGVDNCTKTHNRLLHRVGINPQGRSYLRFLANASEPKQYEFNSLVLGVNASPFLAQFKSQKNARDNKDQYLLAAETVLRSTYMDDGMDSVETDELAIEFHRQLSELWGLAGMNARKWLSNSETVLQKIPVEYRASQIDLSKNELPAIKTLGVLWIAEEERFTLNFTYPDLNLNWTKRLLLKKVALIFDPIGLLMPFTVRSKIILQKLWLEGLDWYDKTSEELKKSMCQWFQELEDLKEVSIPRCLHENKPVATMTMHAFCDASENAYGSAVYARNSYTDGSVSTSLVAAKSIVAPLAALNTTDGADGRSFEYKVSSKHQQSSTAWY